MSPIPPINKDSQNLNQKESIDENDLENSALNNQDSDFILVNNTDDAYQAIPQENQNELGNDQDVDDDDDDDDEDEDSDEEIDPEKDFELLASSRAGGQQVRTIKNDTQLLYNNSHILEADVFERKNTLECEDIIIDDDKKKTINSLMSNFKLPESSIPEWAKLLPENVWKNNLLDSLNAKKTDLFDTKSKLN